MPNISLFDPFKHSLLYLDVNTEFWAYCNAEGCQGGNCVVMKKSASGVEKRRSVLGCAWGLRLLLEYSFLWKEALQCEKLLNPSALGCVPDHILSFCRSWVGLGACVVHKGLPTSAGWLACGWTWRTTTPALGNVLLMSRGPGSPGFAELQVNVDIVVFLSSSRGLLTKIASKRSYETYVNTAHMVLE